MTLRLAALALPVAILAVLAGCAPAGGSTAAPSSSSYACPAAFVADVQAAFPKDALTQIDPSVVTWPASYPSLTPASICVFASEKTNVTDPAYTGTATSTLVREFYLGANQAAIIGLQVEARQLAAGKGWTTSADSTTSSLVSGDWRWTDGTTGPGFPKAQQVTLTALTPVGSYASKFPSVDPTVSLVWIDAFTLLPN